MTNAADQSLSYAKQLAGLGLNVLPAGRGQKAPTVKWTDWQTRRTGSKLHTWFRDGVPSNFWVMTGRMSGICVLDCDNAATIAWWQSKLPLQLVHKVTTSKGAHFYFSLGAEHVDGFGSWSVHREVDGIQLDFDLRCNGTGVIAPGSMHQSGHVYAWATEPDGPGAPGSLADLYDVPVELTSAIAAGLASDGDGRKDASGQTRSILTKLLQTPPDEGGRNDWLTRVAGHYAKEYRTRKDAYEYHVAEAAAKTTLDATEITKITESVWRKEQQHPSLDESNEGAAEFDGENRAPDSRIRTAGPETGWLLSGGDVIMCQTRYKDDNGEMVYGVEPWSDFDLIARGVVDDPNETVPRAYDVTVVRARDGARRDALLYSRDLADNRRLATWLAQHGVSIAPPDNVYPRTGTQGVRLQRYLEAQKPPSFQVAESLGWHDTEAGFICHEGVIRASGIEPFGQVRPAPVLRNRAKYRYGWINSDDGRAVLREILTFHETETAGVFGAWWAASLVKPLIAKRVSQFPFMAIEAPAESGKTKGMFSMLIELGGNSQGQSIYTFASFRDAVAAHNGGVCWMDDANEIDHVLEVLRSATAQGSYTKMAENRTDTVSVQLVAPVCISGEALGISEQKALRDRAVQLAVKSPASRRSIPRPTDDRGQPRAQWLDVMALRERWPDLNDLSGNIVAMAIEAAQLEATADKMDQLRGVYAGKRVADKLAVVRVGSRILAQMTGDPSWVDVVDRWVDTVDLDDIDANTVELKLIPQALAMQDFPDAPKSPEFGRPATPAWIATETEPDPGGQGMLDGLGQPVRPCPRIHVSAANLAEWWRQLQHGRVNQRTESMHAIAAQIKAIRGAEQIRVRVGKHPVKVWVLPSDVSRAIIARARGER